MKRDVEGNGGADFDPSLMLRCVATTESQREIWLGDRLGVDASLSFMLSKLLRLHGPLDIPALQHAINALTERHDALRATLSADGETMLVPPQATIRLDLTDLGMHPLDLRESRAQAVVREVSELPFDLEHGPLFRCTLIKLATDHHLVLLSAHHIVCDGWSWSVLIRELGALYGQACGANATALPVADSFADYAERQERSYRSGAHAEDEAFWMSRFPGVPPVLDLPTDRARGHNRSFASGRLDIEVDQSLVRSLQQLGARRRSGLFSTLLAAYALLLTRLTGDDTVVVGIPAAGQSADGLENLVGHCVNLLPLRFDIDTSQCFNQLVDLAQSTLLDSLEHQKCTFGTLLKKLPITRDPGRVPLVSVLLNLEASPDMDGSVFTGLGMEVVPNPRRQDAFELFLNAVQLRDRGLRLECHYSSDLFDDATVRRWIAAFIKLLESAAAAPDAPATQLSMLDEAAAAELSALQPAPVGYDRQRRMHEHFEQQCDAAPHRIAVVAGSTSLSYAQLERRSNAIAHRLRADGIGQGDRVGLAVPRDADMVAALLGVLKCGAAYVPLDPSFPVERLRFMASDARLQALISTGAHEGQFDGSISRILLDAPETFADVRANRLKRDHLSATPESPAYVIYTSGSTGRPKGVCVPHRAVANFINAMQSVTGFTKAERLVAVTTLSFDIAVLELLLPLSLGACVMLAPTTTTSDAGALMALLAGAEATAMQATPATWRLLLDAGWIAPPGFKMLCGGETLPHDLAVTLLEGSDNLLNLYGPTETTVWSTSARIAGRPDGAPPHVHIGRPIANTQVWILDADCNRLPVGVPGEICIGGDGVTLGYLDRPELTADRFIPDQFAIDSNRPTVARVYRTGDRGRWRTDGVLEHLGRLDNQVKLRGFRIELGEIQSIAARVPGVQQAIAMVREFRPGDARLVLYLAGLDMPDGPEVLDQLRMHLPDYMLPQHVLLLESLPCLPNGKLDRSALPLPETIESSPGTPPRNPLERAIADTMAEVLGIREVGIHDDFFSLGGHSLLAAQLIARLNRRLGISLPWRAMFDAPTVARLAAQSAPGHGMGQSAPMYTRIARRLGQSRAPLTAAQERLLQLHELSPGRSNFNLPTAHRLKGPLDRTVLEHALSTVVSRQSVLRTTIKRFEDSACQCVLDGQGIRLDDAVDLSALPQDVREAELQSRMAELCATRLDFLVQPPFRMALYKLATDEHVFLLVAHHILWDGWSTHLFLAELAECYNALLEHRAPSLPELTVSYGDYAQHQNTWLKSPQYARQREYWQRQMEAGRDAAPLRHDKLLRAGVAGRSGSCAVQIDSITVESLRHLAAREDGTLFMALMSAWLLVLHANTGPGELTIGTPVRGRNHAEVEHLMGFFTSLLPLRIVVDDEATFGQLMRGVRSVVLDGFSHPDIVLEDLLAPMQARRQTHLYHALLSYQDARGRNRDWGGVVRERVQMHAPTTAEDLGLWFVEEDRGLWGQMIYNADAFEVATAARLKRQLLETVALLVGDAHPNALRVGDLRAMLGGATGSEPQLASPAQSRGSNGAQAASGALDSAAGLTMGEQLLLACFADVFGFEDIGLDDNFFELGGNSLLALRLINRVHERSGTRLSLIRLASGTVGSLAREIRLEPPQVTRTQPTGAWRSLFGRPSQ